jgi:pimeloyl-ACP methyl ester carboxylesterase
MECIVQGIPIYYECYGDGVPIILLHGFSLDHHVMTGCIEPLFAQRRGWQRIYLDLPGMGRTPASDQLNTSDDLLEVVLDFIGQVIPNQAFLIVGESYGAYLARGVVLRKFEQINGVALICPMIIADRSQRDLPQPQTIVSNPQLIAALPATDAASFSAMAVVQDEYNWRRVQTEILVGVELADTAFLERVVQHYAFSFDVDALLAQPFTKPTLILLGRQDSTVGYRDTWKIIENYPRGTMAILDRAGHNLQIEQNQLFEALMSEWLDRVQELKFL